jgi:hypothetical protein
VAAFGLVEGAVGEIERLAEARDEPADVEDGVGGPGPALDERVPAEPWADCPTS